MMITAFTLLLSPPILNHPHKQTRISSRHHYLWHNAKNHSETPFSVRNFHKKIAELKESGSAFSAESESNEVPRFPSTRSSLPRDPSPDCIEVDLLENTDSKDDTDESGQLVENSVPVLSPRDDESLLTVPQRQTSIQESSSCDPCSPSDLPPASTRSLPLDLQ